MPILYNEEKIDEPLPGSGPLDDPMNPMGGLGSGSDDSPSRNPAQMFGDTSFTGGYIKSSNFVSGSTGWRITAAGILEASNGIFRGNITAASGNIGGWEIGTDTLSSTLDNIILDAANSQVKVGAKIVLDGANEVIKSSTFVTGVSGWQIGNDTIEAENIRARGTMLGATFAYDIISAIGGQLMIANADILDSDMTALDASTMTIKGDTTFAVDDMLVSKATVSSGIEEEWFRVTDASSAPTYTVTRDIAAQYAADSNPAWQQGTPVVKQGKSSGTTPYSVDLELSSSQYLSITDGDQTGLDLSGDCSFEAWINLEQLPSTAGSTMMILSKYDADRAYRLYLNSADNKLILAVYDDNGAADYDTVTSDNAFVDAGDVGNWVHVAATYDLSGRTGVLYKDASSVASTDGNNGNVTKISNTTDPFAIGCDYNGSGTARNFFDGKIKEARVWSDIRTSGEIDNNYDELLDGTEGNLVACWRFDNDLTDLTSNNNDLTNNGSATFSTDIPVSSLYYSGGWLRLFGEGTNSPYYSVFERTGVAYNAYSEVVRFGNLNGVAGLTSDSYGLFCGDYSNNKYILYDGTDFKIANESIIEASGGAYTLGQAYFVFDKMQIVGNVNDGLNETAGTGTIDRDVMTTDLSTANTACYVYSDALSDHAVSGVNIDWDSDLDFTIALKSTNGTYDWNYFGLIGATPGFNNEGVTNARHICFRIQGTTLSYSVGNGTAQKTGTITGITTTNWNGYRIVFDAGSSVKFYVNGTLKATVSIGFPTGSTNPPLSMVQVVVDGSDPDSAALVFANNYTLTASL